jgi:hypothetical protein
VVFVITRGSRLDTGPPAPDTNGSSQGGQCRFRFLSRNLPGIQAFFQRVAADGSMIHALSFRSKAKSCHIFAY